MAGRTVIVFGPTGGVGSSAARTASELGAAKVVLAMRDPKKAVPGLDEAAEKAGRYERVQADLLQPDSVRDAVSKTGAKVAFIYLMHAAADGMKATIEALKAGGIEHVVFLSSFTVPRGITSVADDDLIGKAHARVELNLLDVFGRTGYFAVRPASFASNTVGLYAKQIARGDTVITLIPDFLVDHIVPEDIGRVAGTVLAKGQLAGFPTADGGDSAVYLYGSRMISNGDSVRIIGKALGRDLKVQAATRDEAVRLGMEDRGLPQPIAEFLADAFINAPRRADGQPGFDIPAGDEDNVHKYTGKKATTFEEYVQQNKHLFSG